jgi:hypothetical protein
MRDLLRKHIDDSEFPLESIIDHYKATNKDLRFDDAYIESMLNTQHGEGRCRALLHLLFPEMDPSRIYHIDHLHPKSEFDGRRLNRHDFLTANKDLLNFYKDPAHWNSIANLHLLNDSQNTSKWSRELNDWFNDSSVHISRSDLLVGEVSLTFESFRDFYLTRRQNLKERLRARVFVATSALETTPQEDFDEEVVEETLK